MHQRLWVGISYLFSVACVLLLLRSVATAARPMAEAGDNPSWLAAAPLRTATPTLHIAYLPLLRKPVIPTVTPSPATDVHVAPGCSQFDAPGNDSENLNEEYVCFENRGSRAANMSGWHVRDEMSALYIFPAFSLAPGARVRLRSGHGSDTPTDLYWGRGQAVWNNDGDTVYLYDTAWNLIDRYSY